MKTRKKKDASFDRTDTNCFEHIHPSAFNLTNDRFISVQSSTPNAQKTNHASSEDLKHAHISSFFFFHFLHLAFSFSKQVPSSLEGKKKKMGRKKCEARTRSHTLARAKKSAQCRLSTHTFTRAFCSHPLRMKGDGRVKKCSLRCLCPSPSCRSCACRRVFPIDRRTSRSLRNDAALLSIFQRMENWVPTTKAKPSPRFVRFPLDLRRVLPTRANTEVVTKQNCSTTIGVAVRNFQKPKRKNNNNFRRKLQCAWRMRDKENLSFYKYAIKKKKYIYKDIRAVWLTSADSNDRVKRRVVPK